MSIALDDSALIILKKYCSKVSLFFPSCATKLYLSNGQKHMMVILLNNSTKLGCSDTGTELETFQNSY